MKTSAHISQIAVTCLLVICMVFQVSFIFSQNFDAPAYQSGNNATAVTNETALLNQQDYQPANFGFIKNSGQVYDYNKNPVSTVFYSLNAGNSSIFLTATGLTYSLIDRDIQSVNPFDTVNRLPFKNCPDKNVARVDFELIGASILKYNISETGYVNEIPVQIIAEGIQPGEGNFRFCSQLLIKNIYPNIDWVLKLTDQHQFKYDFIINPGGDINNIRMKYHGANTIRVNDKKLVLSTELGNITEGNLITYTAEDDKTISSAYQMNNDTLTITAAAYNKKKTLIIDPPVKMMLTWSTYYGGGNINSGGGTICTGIKTDETNNRVYVTGYCFANPFPNYNNGTAYYFSPVQAGSTVEAFISAFDLTGTQLWATYYMSTEYDAAFDITTDQLGHIYMAGVTESSNNSTLKFYTQALNGSLYSYCQQNNKGLYQKQEGFIVRFSSQGVLEWATLFGGNGNEVIYGIACDQKNNVYVTGLTLSSDSFPLLKHNASGYFQNTEYGSQVGFVAGFNVNTQLIWSTCFGTAGSDCRNIVCDGADNIIISGVIGSTAKFPFTILPNAYNCSAPGYFIAEFYNSSKIKWCTSLQDNQYIKNVCINRADQSIMIAGSTTASSLFQWSNYSSATPGTYFDNSYNGGDYDGFIMVFNKNRNIDWSTLYGGNGKDQITAAKINATGKLFITGYTDNSLNSAQGNLPLVNPGNQTYFQGNLGPNNPAQIFLTTFSPRTAIKPFELIYATLIGDVNTGIEYPYDLDISTNGLFITGSVLNEPVTPSFPLVKEGNGFLQSAVMPLVNGFNPSGGNGLILKFRNEVGGSIRLQENITENKLSLYPNPCSGNFIYIDHATISDAEISIVDAAGKCIRTLTLNNAENNQVSIEVNDLKSGYYMVIINQNGNRTQLPFVKI